MITAEGIKSVNERVKKIEVKGKNYTCVSARVAAFRELCPQGTITTDIINMADGVVTMKTTVSDETGKVLATGMAQEKESSSYINKTSYIENCETSSVGRALGMLGIGSDEQMASAEELANALNNQKPGQKAEPKQNAEQKRRPTTMSDPISPAMVNTLKEMCKHHNMPESVLLERYQTDSFQKLTMASWRDWSNTGKEFLAKWDAEHGKDHGDS